MNAPTRLITRDTFAETFDVPIDCLERLDAYEKLLKQWQTGTNLVAPSTLDTIWHRHFADSAQLLRIAGEWQNWIDLGSGAGFPGLVVAICAANREDATIHLVESNARKCAFLQEVVRETGCAVEIHHCRIESLSSGAKFGDIDIVSARALAPLDRLFSLTEAYFSSDTTGLFLKGERAQDEIDASTDDWSCKIDMHPSITSSDGQIVQVTALQRKS